MYSQSIQIIYSFIVVMFGKNPNPLAHQILKHHTIGEVAGYSAIFKSFNHT